MRIDASTSYLYASQRPQATASGGSTPTSFTATLNATQADSTKQANFSSMTRQEMRDWVNGQIRSGKMSLDDSQPFMAMTMKIPVGGSGGELPAANDGRRYDFTQQVRDGIQGALSRNDETTLNMLQSAMSIMQQNQGQTIGVNVRV
ncbi:hypothetical protein [Bradyrhizobium sp. USDA 4473]